MTDTMAAAAPVPASGSQRAPGTDDPAGTGLPGLAETQATVHALGDDLPPALVDALVGAVLATGGSTVSPVAPFTGRALFTLPLSTEEDVQQAFARARAAQVEWAARPVAERAAIIGRVHDLAFARQRELLDLLQLEGGKARYDAFQEVAAVAVYARYVSRTAPGLLRTVRRKGIVPVLTQAYEVRHPKGVVGLVTAWNYPAVFASSDGFAALVAGNAVVHRPDVQTALSALWVRSLAVEAGLPEDLWQVVLGPGRTVGTAVVDAADHLAFTGSTAAGRQIAARVAPRLATYSLELGGKNPFLVLEDANLRGAVDAVVRACFVNAGQTCVGPERILVLDEVYDEFVALLVERVRGLRVGAGLTYAHEMGCLISAEQLAAVRAHVDDAVARGARVLAGGRPRPDLGPTFFEPTVLEGVTPEMAVCREETFGPVVSLYRCRDRDEAVAMANDTEFGLHAVVWSRDVAGAKALAQRVRAGTVEINESILATWGSADVPQGGMRDSGVGRRNGRDGILRFTEPQSVVVQRVRGLYPPGSMGHELFAAVMTHSLKAIHRTGRA